MPEQSDFAWYVGPKRKGFFLRLRERRARRWYEKRIGKRMTLYNAVVEILRAEVIDYASVKLAALAETRTKFNLPEDWTI